MPRSTAIAALAMLATGCDKPAPVEPGNNGKDVVLIVIDTLRGDSVERARTPQIDALARQGQSALAWAPGTWTAPSTLSLMTGSHLRDHGWDLPFPDKLPPGQVYPALDDRQMLGEVMQAAGYHTVGVYANPLLSRSLGWERGFDEWTYGGDVKLPRRLKKHVADAPADKPLFLYVHYLGPHQPLKPSQAAGDRWGVDWSFLARYRKGLRRKFIKNGPAYGQDQYYRLYHAEVEDADRRLQKLWKAIGPRVDDAVVILTSDHGEMLGEHGVFGHGSHVWDQVTRVPLVVRGSDVALPEMMSTVGVADLVTRSAGISATWPETVESSWPLVSQREGMVALTADGVHRGVWLEPGSPHVDVYDLSRDAEERHAIGDVASAAAAQMQRHAWATGRTARQIAAKEGELDDDTRALLEELGYLGVDDEVLAEE